jgi:hypothetical protein
MGKTRTKDNAYLVVRDDRMPDWTTYVLKAYTMKPDAPYARWFCLVVTPFTGSMGDMGDTYIEDVRGFIVKRDPAVTDDCLPEHLR